MKSRHYGEEVVNMDQSLDGYVAAYGDEFDFSLDNRIMLNWVSKRIMSLTNRSCAVLELGIGHGYTSNLFSEYYAKYSVVEGSRAVIEKFSQEYPGSRAQIIQGYFEQFDSRDLFDAVVMGFVLEHVDDPALVLTRFKRFIGSNGRCFITVPNAESLHRRLGHNAGLLPDILALGSSDLELGHKRLYTVASITQQIEECGYRILRKEGIFLKAFTTSQLKSLNLSPEIFDAMCQIGIEYPELSNALLLEAEVAG